MARVPHRLPTLNALYQRYDNVSDLWIQTRLNRSSFRPQNGRYSEDCVAWLDEQVAALQRVPPIGDYYTIPRAAEALCTTHARIVKVLAAYNMIPARRRLPSNHIVKCLSPERLSKLGVRLHKLAPADWKCAHQLEIITGWPWQTVVKRLAQAGVKGQPMRDCDRGHVLVHYPPTAVKILGYRPAPPPPGGSWLTARRICVSMDRSNLWVNRRLAQPIYRCQAQLRLTDNGVARLHYPPWVLRELQQESAAS